MKIRKLLALLLVAVVLLQAQSLFTSTLPGTNAYSTAGNGTTALIVAKENYVFARLHIEVEPSQSGPSQQVQPATFAFPNGTVVEVTSPMAFDVVLPNEVYYSFGFVAGSGPGYSVSQGRPLSVGFLGGQNATNLLVGGAQGIQIYRYLVTGDAFLQVTGLGVSL